VGRELILYQLIDLSGVPRNLQSKVLEQKIRQLVPFEHASHFAIPIDDSVMVWMWDESARQVALDALIERQSILADHFKKLKPIPETLLHPCSEFGEIVQSCFKGSDQQKWLDGKLVSSQWRSSSVDADSAQVLIEPWGDKNPRRLVDEQLLTRAGILVFAVVITFQLGSISRLFWETSQLERDLLSSREEVSEILDAREEVQVTKKENDLLVSWLSVPSQIAILADFDELLTPATVDIIEWDYQDGELKVTVEDKSLENRAYLESLSGGARFSNVRVDPGIAKNTAIIRLKVI